MNAKPGGFRATQICIASHQLVRTSRFHSRAQDLPNLVNFAEAPELVLNLALADVRPQASDVDCVRRGYMYVQWVYGGTHALNAHPWFQT